MAMNFNEETWKDFLEKFSSYEGNVSSYCKENNMTKSQFYYYKKKFMKENKPIFHAIEIKNENSNQPKASSSSKKHSDIRIELGRANIYLPTEDPALVSSILKELSKIC
jgi:ATPase subunit of ABC transporter with duplicated ATPase domains